MPLRLFQPLANLFKGQTWQSPPPPWANIRDLKNIVCCAHQLHKKELVTLNSWQQQLSKQTLTVLSLDSPKNSKHSCKLTINLPNPDAWNSLQNFYALTRPMVNVTVDSFLTRYPELTSIPDFGTYLCSGLTHRFQLMLGNDHAPLIAQCASDKRTQQTDCIVILNSVFNSEQWQSWFSKTDTAHHVDGNNTLQHIVTAYTTTQQGCKKRLDKLSQRVGSNTAINYGPHPLLIVTGHPRHEQLLTPLINAAKTYQQTPVIFNYGGYKPASNSFFNHYPNINGQTLRLESPTVQPLIQCLKRTLKSLNDYSQDLWLFDHVITLAENFLTAQTLCNTLVSPKNIVGCLEKNSLGPILSHLSNTDKFTLHNIEHGRIFDTRTLDLMAFDNFIVWDKNVAALARAEGSPSHLSIIGNPDEPDHYPTLDESNPEIQQLVNWLTDRKLILATTQSYRGYYTAKLKQQYLQILFDYCRHRPEVCLLIRTHPAETDSMVADMITEQPVYNRNRIRHQHPGALPYKALLPLVDVVTSVYSTTVLEAIWYGVPSLAIDPHGINAFTGMPMSTLTVAATADETYQKLDELLTLAKVPPPPKTYSHNNIIKAVFEFKPLNKKAI